MPKPLDNYFAFNHAAMTVKSQRLELISGNIANASTPGFKAKDLDFSSLLRSSFDKSENGPEIPLGVTNSKHMGHFDGQVGPIKSLLSLTMSHWRQVSTTTL